MFGCDQYQVGFNDMKYCNPELDEINDQAKRTFDEEARRELLIQASNIVNDEQPVGDDVLLAGPRRATATACRTTAQHLGRRSHLRLDPTVVRGDGVIVC